MKDIHKGYERKCFINDDTTHTINIYYILKNYVNSTMILQFTIIFFWIINAI